MPYLTRDDILQAVDLKYEDVQVPEWGGVVRVRGPGRVIGGRWYALPEVHHPGTAPRAWPTVIGKQLQHFYSRSVENAWRRALRRMNQG